jgi:putative transposase
LGDVLFHEGHYKNPIRAGLSQRAQDYKYSTLNTSISLPFNIEEIVPLTLQSRNKELETCWLNETFSEEENSSIRSGLSKPKFSYKKHRSRKIEIKPDFKF